MSIQHGLPNSPRGSSYPRLKQTSSYVDDAAEMRQETYTLRQGTMGNLGMYATGIPAGILIDTRSPRWGVGIGTVLFGAGYYPLAKGGRMQAIQPRSPTHADLSQQPLMPARGSIVLHLCACSPSSQEREAVLTSGTRCHSSSSGVRVQLSGNTCLTGSIFRFAVLVQESSVRLRPSVGGEETVSKYVFLSLRGRSTPSSSTSARARLNIHKPWPHADPIRQSKTRTG